jgi:Ca2+-binding RTX toxin-like protein
MADINGTPGNDTLAGTRGNDNINGGPGNDTINGGNGADTLTGGPGADVFVFGGDTDNAPDKTVVTDYQPGVDHFHHSPYLEWEQSGVDTVRFYDTGTETLDEVVQVFPAHQFTDADFV